MDMTNVVQWVLDQQEAPKSSMDRFGTESFQYFARSYEAFYADSGYDNFRAACGAMVRLSIMHPDVHRMCADEARDHAADAQDGGSGIIADIFYDTSAVLKMVESAIRGY